MADYTKDNLGNLSYAVSGGAGGPAPSTVSVDIDATGLAAVLATGDTIDVMAVEAGTLVLGACVEVIDPMTGTALVDDAIAVELENDTGNDIASGCTPSAAAGAKTTGATANGTDADTNVQLAFSLTSGTVTANGKYRVSLVLASV